MEHDTTNRCINTSHIVKIKFRLYTWRHHPALLSRNLFADFGTFVSRVKLRVLEKSPICQMTKCAAIAITQGKIDTCKLEFFYDTWNCLEVTIPSCQFLPYS